VVDLDGTPLGEVKALVHGSAQDLLTVRTTDGRDALVPFVSALVPEVDLAAGRLVVADRPGLVSPFPEDAPEAAAEDAAEDAEDDA
jgi:16S rRNA processing protein RimM